MDEQRAATALGALDAHPHHGGLYVDFDCPLCIALLSSRPAGAAASSDGPSTPPDQLVVPRSAGGSSRDVINLIRFLRHNGQRRMALAVTKEALNTDDLDDLEALLPTIAEGWELSGG